MSRISRNSVSLAGEHAVLAQLMLAGYNANMTLGNTKNIDILVLNPETDETYQVEVKTNLEERKNASESRLFGRFVTDWQMDKKHETIEKKTLFYCFVHINLSKSEHSERYKFRFFVVPSNVVAKYIRDEHRLWLEDKPGRKDTDRRLFRIGLKNEREIKVSAPLAEKYENNWKFNAK
jgi:hypothetical protein